MRWKIIFVNGGIVLLLAVLTYVLLASSLTNVVADRGEQKKELARALRAAESQLVLDALRTERWLNQQATTDAVRRVYEGGTLAARSDWATSAANTLRDRAVADPSFARMAPSLVLFVDDRGVGIGRNGSALMRGDKLAASYPNLATALQAGVTQSDVWINEQRQEQLLVSYAPVRDEDGRVRGALVLGTPLNDERLLRTSELSSGHSLAFLRVQDEAATVVAASGPGSTLAREAAVGRAALQALKSGSPAYVGEAISERYYGAIRLGGYLDSNAVIVASVPTSRVASIDGLLWPVFAVAALGLGLVVAGGVMVGNYVSRPVAELEEGLLMIISGNQNIRFELEHDELGGLASRINTLLNSLLGVAEDNTDEQGRSSSAPSGRSFNEALAVDESSVSQPNTEMALAQALAAIPAEEYYAQLYESYVGALRRVGNPVDHITPESFRTRITSNEQEMLAKHGRRVRYQVEVKDNGVVLMAIPLPQQVASA